MPGRIHTIILGNHPERNKKYRILRGLYVDVNLKDVSDIMCYLLMRTHSYVTLLRDNVVEGRSWEMSAVLAQEGFDGVSTGEVSVEPLATSGNHIRFSEVLGLPTKSTMYKNLISSKILKSINSFL